MARGPGKYDHLASWVREHAQADGVAVIVLDGTRGAGFSFQASNPRLLALLPAALRRVADTIEADLKQPPAAFTCPRCGMTSHHPQDAQHGYCGHCHRFTDEAPLP
jgi:hypothetical protein